MCSVATFPRIMKRKERTPILPINIKIIKITLPVELNVPVIPVESPVVPKAEQTSKKIISIGIGSVIEIMMVDVVHSTIATIITINDFCISSG